MSISIVREWNLRLNPSHRDNFGSAQAVARDIGDWGSVASRANLAE